MNFYIWIAQIILALIFFGSGLAKLTMSKEKMTATGQTGAASQPLSLVRFVAFCEVLGAVGVIAPTALGIDRFLTPLAALGFAIIMIGAARIHSRLKEPKAVVVNIVLLGLSIFVACGRWVSP
jgi:uncharacterized membrane protein YphA (DoxX/SURF4 family)